MKKMKYFLLGLAAAAMVPGVATDMEVSAKNMDSYQNPPMTDPPVLPDKGEIKSGWIIKGKNRYYRNKKGRLLKNGVYKIKGSYYRFDKKGRMFTGIWKDQDGFTNTFGKDGKCRSRYLPVKIQKMNGNGSFRAIPYKHPDKSKRKSFVANLKGKTLVDKKGRTEDQIPWEHEPLNFRKGDIIRIYTWDWDTPKTGKVPQKAYKIQLVKHTDNLDWQIN